MNPEAATPWWSNPRDYEGKWATKLSTEKFLLDSVHNQPRFDEENCPVVREELFVISQINWAKLIIFGFRQLLHSSMIVDALWQKEWIPTITWSKSSLYFNKPLPNPPKVLGVLVFEIRHFQSIWQSFWNFLGELGDYRLGPTPVKYYLVLTTLIKDDQKTFSRWCSTLRAQKVYVSFKKSWVSDFKMSYGSEFLS